MAYLYIRTSLIKASSGKSAVASAAYMSAQSLYNERLGMTFQYRHKEEVVHSEVVESGKSATAPTVDIEGYDFIVWDKDFSNVTKDLVVNAILEVKGCFLVDHM